MLLPFVIFAILLVLTLLVVLYFLYPGAERVSTIPGLDPTNEVEGNLPDVKKAGSLPVFLVNLHKEFGPIVSFWYKKQFTVSVASPELFKETAHLFDRPGILYEDYTALIGVHSIQFACGSDGQTRRKIQERAYNHDAVAKKISLYQEVGEEVAAKWAQMGKKGEHIPVSTHMFAAVLKIITRFSFGDYFKNEKALINFRKDYDETFRVLDTVYLDGPIEPGSDREKRFQEARGRMQDVVTSIIRERQNAEISPDDKLFIDLLLDLYDNEDQLFDDCVTYMIGGYHTTACALTWVFYFLALHPEVQDRCYEEITSVWKSGSLDREAIKQLKYLEQVLNETMRITRIAPYAARFATHDMMLGGHKVPKNTPIMQSLGVMAADEELWEDPNKFDPDRFSEENKPNRSYVFEPFGFAGKRKCPGYRLTEVEAVVMMAIIMKKFKFSLVPGQKIEFKYELITQPSDEVWITAEERVKSD